MEHAFRKIAVALSAGLLVLLAGTAIAAKDLTKAEVKAKLEAAGYTKVSHIRREKNHFDAKGMKDGHWVAVDVDAKNGSIVQEKKESEETEEHEHGKK